MLVLLPNGTSVGFNFRERAGRKAHTNMYDQLPLESSRYGGLSVAIP